MSRCELAIQLLKKSTEDQESVIDNHGLCYFPKLGIYVDVKEVQVMENPKMALLISEFKASLEPAGPGMIVTSVGLGENVAGAIGNAVGQWGLGVLPVLTSWRGEHTCFVDEGSEVLQKRFRVLGGPIVGRGMDSDSSEPSPQYNHFSSSFLKTLERKKLSNRIHWIEAYAVRHNDGSVDATCRLDNFDWAEGRNVLLEVAKTWPIPKESLQSCRQFLMFIPTSGDTTKLVVPSFWSRLLGRT